MKNLTSLKSKSILGRAFTLLSLLAFTSLAFSQQRTCGTDDFMKQKLQDPTFAKQYEKRQARFESKLSEIQTQKANGTYKKATLLIPVAVHFPAGSEANRACLEALAQSEIDILNADYTGTNADIANWAAASVHYPGVNTGAADVLFCIATLNHPANTDNDLVEGGPAVTIGYNFGNGGDSDSKWAGYMNFLVKDAGGGILGYSPLGGDIASGASVVISSSAFGSGSGCSGYVPGAPYNLGRTTTHELGHFYNLDHTFQGGCSGSGDSVGDTPAVANESYGCPAAGSVAGCVSGQKALTMSYMDYVNDACMYMFSAGQTDRAEAYLATIAADFKQNVTAACGSPDFELSVNNSPVAVCSPANGIFNLDFVTSGGYSDNTTFTATAGVPAGANIAFSPNSLSADGNFTMTVSNIAAVTPGNYTITITATGSISKTIDVVLSVETGAPATATLTYPSNGANGLGTTVPLTWNAVANAATYTVQTATDAAFTTNLTTNSVSTTNHSSTGLTPNTQYFWRVKSVNGCGESAYSSVFNFTTEPIACTSYNSTQNNINIPSSGSTEHVITSTLNVPTNIDITDVNVTINVQHTWAGDVELKLTSPNGTEVILLANSKCDDGTNDIAVTYDDQASGPVVCSTSPPSVGGTIQPENPLSAFIGEQSGGNWTVTATDGYPSEDGGTFLNFTLNICGTPILTSIQENIETDIFSLWPNPSDGTINVSFNSVSNEDVILNLYDISGRLIDTQSFKNNSDVFNQKVRFKNVKPAIYVLKIQSGTTHLFKKLIVR